MISLWRCRRRSTTKDLFWARLDQIVHTKHELVQLAASYRRQDRAALQRRRPAGIETPMRRRVNVGSMTPISNTLPQDGATPCFQRRSRIWPIEYRCGFGSLRALAGD